MTAIQERDRDMGDASQPGGIRVLIAGGGPAAAEAALTLERIAGRRVCTTIVAPQERLVRLPPTVLSPFAVAEGARLRLGGLGGAQLHRGALVSVDSAGREVTLSDGEVLAYDALLVAVGGVHRSPYPRALAFGTPGSEERMHGLIQDVEDGYVKRVAFVVPSHASWSLPIYELALTMAERAFDMCADVELTLLTPEPSPLAVFGPSVSRDVGQMLARAGISVRSGVNVEMPFGNVLELHPTGGRLNVDRVVTVPIVTGPAIEGLPHDAAGFLPVDDYGRVLGASCVYAAGDATNFSVKQGGIACQQADAAAEAIAADAGVAIRPTRFAPVLRGVLVTEHDTRWLGYDDAGQPLPDPRRAKLSGRELSRLLVDAPTHWS